MRLRTRRPGRIDPCTRVSEEESNPLASASAQGRRRAVRAQSLAILHKVGCSWSASADGVLVERSAGPTTPPPFERSTSTPSALQTGEPTVSHEGGSGVRLLFRSISDCHSHSFATFAVPRPDGLGTIRSIALEEESNPLASASAQGRRRAVRAQSLATLHKVGCSWSAAVPGVFPSGSAGPTTPPRFEPKGNTPGTARTGEPTVSHEGCSGRRLLLHFSYAVMTDG